MVRWFIKYSRLLHKYFYIQFGRARYSDADICHIFLMCGIGGFYRNQKNDAEKAAGKIDGNNRASLTNEPL